MKMSLFSIPVLGALSIFGLSACQGGSMTDHGHDTDAGGGHAMAGGSGMTGMHEGGMMDAQDSAMMARCMKMKAASMAQ